jgi:hypothetical protein
MVQGEFKMNMKINTFLLCIFFLFVMLACNMPNVTGSSQPDLALTVTAQALFIQQTSEALTRSQAQVQPQSQPAVASTETLSPMPASTNTAEPSATPQQPQVINSTLCWVGPGDQYEVVSSVNKGQTVEILGRGSISDWFIIRNPRYNDPCWVRARDLKVDASLDLNSLKIFDPPPLPTNTPKPTLIPSPTPV